MLSAEQIFGGGHVVGMGGRGLYGVHLAHQRVQRRRAFAGREDALLSGRRAEGHRADRVAPFERHVGQQHHSVQHLVEMCGADRALPIVCAHAPPAVDEQQDALVALVLELADDRFAQPQRSSPVDVAHRITDAVVG